ANVLRVERLRHPAEVFNAQAGLLELPLGAVKDGEILNRLGVAILEATEGDALPVDLPAPPNELESVEGVEIPFLQRVSREWPGILRAKVRQFLNLKVLRPLFDLHAGSVRDSARA